MNIIDFISQHTDIASLVIFTACIALFVWDKLPMATSAILGCAVMVLLGISSFNTAFSSFSSTTVIMLIGVLIIGMAIEETGVASRIGHVIIKVSNGSERTFLLVVFLIAFVLSTFMTNVTVLAIFMPIIFALGKSRKQIRPMNLIIPVTLAVNAGGITTLVGSSQQMTAQGLLEEYGYTAFEVFDFTVFGLIIGAVSLLYSLFVGYPLGKKIWGNRVENLPERELENEEIEVKKSKAISISVIIVLMVFLYVVQKIPFTDITVPPHVTSTLAALACIITGCISQKKAVTELNWNIVGRLAACLGLAKVLQEAGGINIISDAFMLTAGTHMSPFAIFVVLVLFAQIVSLFISNSTAISVALLVVMAIAPSMSLNVPAYAMGIVLCASLGCSCPLSGSTWGISMAAGYKFKDYFKYGILIDILGFIAVVVSVPMIMGLTTI